MTSRTALFKRLRQSTAASAVAIPILMVGLSSCAPKVTVPNPGTAMPTASNTGVPAGLAMTPVWGNVTVTKPGTVLSGLDIHGFVYVKTSNVTIKNSRIHGSGTGSFETGLVDANNAAVRNLVVENCELTHDATSIYVDGVVGHDYTALRNNVHNVVDGFGVMNPRSKTADLNVTIQNNYVHDLDYLSPDRTHPDNHTHNDGVQIQGTGSTHGKVQVRITGNNIQALVGPHSNLRSPYFPAVTGQGIGVTPNVSQIHDVVITGNWLNGGAQSVTMIPGSKGVGTGMVLSNNKFGSNQGTHRAVLIQAPVQLSSTNNRYLTGRSVTIAR